jgi:hypothetical protein
MTTGEKADAAESGERYATLPSGSKPGSLKEPKVFMGAYLSSFDTPPAT